MDVVDASTADAAIIWKNILLVDEGTVAYLISCRSLYFPSVILLPPILRYLCEYTTTGKESDGSRLLRPVLKEKEQVPVE